MRNRKILRSVLPFLTLAITALLASLSWNEAVAQNAISSDWFKVTEVKPGVYMIDEPKSQTWNVSYLIVGTERAVMTDSGSGENDPVNGTKIRHIIDQITDLPVTLLPTHFHYDHLQNITEFDKVAFVDLIYLRNRTDENGVFKFTPEELAVGTYPESTKVDEWWPMDTAIDLGGRSIKVWSIPGHTPESIVIADEENKIAFVGDSYSSGFAIITGEEGKGYTSAFDDYLRSLKFLIARMDDSYRILGSHGEQKFDYAGLTKLETLVTCVKYNNCEAPPKFMDFGGVIKGDVYSIDDVALMYLPFPKGYFDHQHGEKTDGNLEAEIRAAEKKSQDMYNAHDAKGYASLFTENAVRLAPDGSFIRGREEIQKDIQLLFDAGLVNNKLEVIELGGEGNTAWVNGKYSLDLPDENKKLKTYTGNYTVVYERGADDVWRIRVDSWNEDP